MMPFTRVDSDSSPNILIADDHVLLAEAVAAMLSAQCGAKVTTAPSLPACLAALGADHGYDAILLDLKMPGMVGLSSIAQVIGAAGEGKVVLFTGAVDTNFLNSALEMGVKGLIHKTMPLQSLNAVIQFVLSGQIFVPVVNTQNSAAPMADGGKPALTEKELFVLREAADGLTNKEIAREMAISEVMVKSYMRSVCKKLGARNRAHAAMVSREMALI